MFDLANTIISLPEEQLTLNEDVTAFYWMKEAELNGSEEALGHMAMLTITGESKWCS